MKKYKIIFSLFFLFFHHLIQAIPQYYCTAADSKYFPYLIQLISTIHKTNFDNLVEISVYNLGLTEKQKQFLCAIDKLDLCELNIHHNPAILKPVNVNAQGKVAPGWYAWKPLAIQQALKKYPYVIWIDAGAAVLQPLDTLFDHIQQTGYLLVNIGEKLGCGYIGHTVAWQSTQFLVDAFDLRNKNYAWILQEEPVACGFVGFANTCSLAEQWASYTQDEELRYFCDDGTAPEGFGCARHDQALLTILAYKHGYDILPTSYTQQTPTLLYDKTHFYITWHNDFVDEKTHVHQCRGYLGYFKDCKNYIRFK